jgi:hypothetical protein
MEVNPYLCKSVPDPCRLDRTSKMTDFGMLELLRGKVYLSSTRPAGLRLRPILVHDCRNMLLSTARFLHRYYSPRGRFAVAFVVRS